MPWYLFTPSGIQRDPFDPNQYTLLQFSPTVCVGEKQYLHAVQAMDNMGSPVFSVALMREIGWAFENRMQSTNVLLKAHPY